MTTNPFEVLDEIKAAVFTMAADVRALKSRTTEKQANDRIDLDTFCKEYKYARRTAYKLCHFKKVPYFKVGGRLWFRRSELEQWIDAGRRRTVAEVAVERMERGK